MPYTTEFVNFILEQNASLNDQVARLTKTVDEMAQQIKELNEKLNKNSKNSSKPPSTDGFKKPKNTSLREPSGKKPGGQKGHEGKNLSVTDKPDHRKKCMPEKCKSCPHRAECEAKAEILETRYSVDIVAKTDTTAYERCRVQCPESGKTLNGNFPEGINAHVQYGENLAALAVSLSSVGALSLNRIHEILGGVFDIPISVGTIYAMVLRAAGKTSPVVTEIGKQVIQEYQAHADETGTRVNNKNRWVHVLCTSTLTFLALHEKRGKKAMDDIGLLKQFHGILTHDCWSSYWSCEGTFLHSVCCAHLLRELNGVMENYPEQKWAKKLSMLLIEMKKIRDMMAESGHTALKPCYLDKFDEAYDKIIKLALEENPLPENPEKKKGRRKKGKVRALIERLQKYKGEVCLFARDFAVPFDNNQAERDFRAVKTKTKVSGCFRTEEGAKAYVTIMSYVGTAKKRGINAFKAILNAFTGDPMFILA